MSKHIDVDELKEWIQNWFEKNRYYHPYSKSNDIPIPELYDILEQMSPVQSESQWIPCSKKMPEKYIGQWLCCTSDGDIMVLPYDTPGDGTKECVFYKWDDDGYFYDTFDVIAWMPLPKSYKEELKLR